MGVTRLPRECAIDRALFIYALLAVCGKGFLYVGTAATCVMEVNTFAKC